MPDATEAAIAEVNRIHTRYGEVIERLQGDKMLSDQGRAQKLARAFVEADDAVARVRNRAENARTAEVGKLEKKVLGPGSSLYGSDKVARDASFRDALGRANSAASEVDGSANPRIVQFGGVERTVSERSAVLIDLLNQAELVGDDLQARAVVTVGWAQRDLNVINAWVAAHPDSEGDWQRLWDLVAGVEGEDMVATLMTAFDMRAPNLPPEISHLGPTAIRQLAAL